MGGGSLEVKDSNGNNLLTEADLVSVYFIENDRRTKEQYNVALEFNKSAISTIKEIIQVMSDGGTIGIFINETV